MTGMTGLSVVHSIQIIPLITSPVPPFANGVVGVTERECFALESSRIAHYINTNPSGQLRWGEYRKWSDWNE